MTTGSTASRKAYSMSLLTMTHQGSCCTTPLHIVQQAAALYLLETRQTSCNCFSDPFSSSAPGFISITRCMAFIHHTVAAPGSYRADGQPSNLPKPSTQHGAVRKGMIASRRKSE